MHKPPKTAKIARIPVCGNHTPYSPSVAKAKAKSLSLKTGKKFNAYWCEESNAHWHVGLKRGHVGRQEEPHNICDKCGREIRVKRYLKHLAKCTGLNTGEGTVADHPNHYLTRRRIL